MVVVARVCVEGVVPVAGGGNRVAAEVVLGTAELGVVAAQRGDGQGDGSVRLEFARERRRERESDAGGWFWGMGEVGKMGKKREGAWGSFYSARGGGERGRGGRNRPATAVGVGAASWG